VNGSAAPRRPRRVRYVVVAAVLAATILAVLGAVAVSQSRDPVTHRYVIPPGTGARLDAGERIEVFPRVLRVRVGDRLVVRNDDDRRHHAGPISVDPGSRMEMTFGREGELRGECTLNVARTYRIIVGS
jgi:hypothetical protein